MNYFINIIAYLKNIQIFLLQIEYQFIIILSLVMTKQSKFVQQGMDTLQTKLY